MNFRNTKFIPAKRTNPIGNQYWHKGGYDYPINRNGIFKEICDIK